MVSRNCFAALGAAAMVSRTFQVADFDAAAPLVALIGYRLWQTTFGRDSQIAGRHVLMNGADYKVIGAGCNIAASARPTSA
jgi:hypothetical protein